MNKFIIIFTLLLTQITFASQYKFRVQCATSKEKQFSTLINEIPELSHYMLPNGEKIYFSGKYFEDYNKAEQRLNQVLALGFCNAEIRVFKYNQYLSNFLSTQYLPIAIAQNNNKVELYKLENEILEKKTIQNLNKSSNKFLPKSSVLPSFSQNKTMFKPSFSTEEITKNESLSQTNSLVANSIINDSKKTEKLQVLRNEVVAPSIEKYSDVSLKIQNEISDLVKFDIQDTASLLDFVDEVPSFKIQLVKTEKVAKAVDLVENLLETVYQFETPQSLILTVGYYKESSLAQPKVMHYVLEGYPDAKVVGIFKGYVVSKELAEDLVYFYTYRKSKQITLK